MMIKKHIPNALTLSNLFCGILAVKYGLESEFYISCLFVIMGAIFDFFDGFVARLLKVNSLIGKELDSMADMVTFGVAPGIIIFSMINIIIDNNSNFCISENIFCYKYYIPYIAFIIPLSSAIRLAKFNIDENQSDKFIGLPTPANSMFFIFLPIIYIEYLNKIIPEKLLLLTLITLIFVFSWLLNAKIEMLALKFKSITWKNNELKFIFIGISIVLIIISIFANKVYVSIPISILIYIIVSIINNKIINNKL